MSGIRKDDFLEIINGIRSAAKSPKPKSKVFEDWFGAIRLYFDNDVRSAGKFLAELRNYAQAALTKRLSSDEITKTYDIIGRTYLYEARELFDSYCIYLEWRRDPEKKFYQPRRRVLKVLVDDMQDLADHKIDFLGVSLPPRVGKLVSDDTPVLTRNGWKLHGELIVGDEVISPSGRFVKVTHVFPKHYANVRVRFTDGGFVDVHEKHEWQVYDKRTRKIRIMETCSMHGDYKRFMALNNADAYCYALPHRHPLRGVRRVLPVKPYVMGLWLANGEASGIYCTKPKILRRILREGYSLEWNRDNVYGYLGLRDTLLSLGFLPPFNHKWIPGEYLTASIEQRLELLAGIIDACGKLHRRKCFRINAGDLSEDVVSLVSTFGWECDTSVKDVVTFWPDIEIPCAMPHRQNHEFAERSRVCICGIERIPEKPGNCISVEGGLYCVGERLIPTHNSTLGIFFMTWMMGKNPDVASVMTGHSDKLTDGFYSEVLQIITDESTYNWHEVFPEYSLIEKSAKNETIDIGRKRRFPTLTCRSVGGTLTGAVEIGTGGVLYCDDLIEDLEESLNPQRLQAKYEAYLNQLKDRKKQGALELMVGTRWCIGDPLGRIAEQYKDNLRYRFRVIPAIDENGHSNFLYDYGLGFDDDYYADMRSSIDDATWSAKYLGKPYLREGLLFPRDSLRRYNGVLPDGEPDYKRMVADIAWGGGDYFSAPIAYVYGKDVYIVDVVFNNGDKTITMPETAGKIKHHEIRMFLGEANNGGNEYCERLDDVLRNSGYHANIRSRRAPVDRSKLERIFEYSPEIQQFIFLEDRVASQEYIRFLDQLTTFSQTGKNPHDDAADSLALLAEELNGGVAVVQTMRRPF